VARRKKRAKKSKKLEAHVKVAKASFWERYHNHIYAVLSLLVGFIFYFNPFETGTPLSKAKHSIKVFVSTPKINKGSLLEFPKSWQGKASFSRFDYYTFEMVRSDSILRPSSRGRSIPTAVYTAGNLTFPQSLASNNIETLFDEELKLYIPYEIYQAYGENASCWVELQIDGNTSRSGAKKCFSDIEVSFPKKS
jgi:hypothetical protein